MASVKYEADQSFLNSQQHLSDLFEPTSLSDCLTLFTTTDFDLDAEFEDCPKRVQCFNRYLLFFLMNKLQAEFHQIQIKILAIPHLLIDNLLDNRIDLLPVLSHIVPHESEQNPKQRKQYTHDLYPISQKCRIVIVMQFTTKSLTSLERLFAMFWNSLQNQS